MTAPVFRVAVLPAGVGDALILEYGTAGETRRVLIDGGVANTASGIEKYLLGCAELELLVVSHIDSDHIGGILTLLGGANAPQPKDIWFNGYKHLFRSSLVEMGPRQGEALTSLIERRGYRWNDCFDGRAVARADDGAEPLPCHTLTGGLTCTVLSPGYADLERLRATWERTVSEAEEAPPAADDVTEQRPTRVIRMGAPNIGELADESTQPDRAVANGSSIALLVEYEGYRCLLGADAHPDVLLDGINRVIEERGERVPLEVDLFKLPHHGSKANVTRELIARVNAKAYVFSSDGGGRQRHPDDQAVARVIKYGGEDPLLVFNYRSVRNERWDDDLLQRLNSFRTQYPSLGDDGIVIDIAALGGR
jgi:beta-lactamase superfamily II metal-dependent hydrolase